MSAAIFHRIIAIWMASGKWNGVWNGGKGAESKWKASKYPERSGLSCDEMRKTIIVIRLTLSKSINHGLGRSDTEQSPARSLVVRRSRLNLKARWNYFLHNSTLGSKVRKEMSHNDHVALSDYLFSTMILEKYPTIYLFSHWDRLQLAWLGGEILRKTPSQ